MPLSTLGISHQIVSSLVTYRTEGFGTVNDCKVVLNHLIRKFSEPLAREGLQQVYHSARLSEGDEVVREHLIPVREIMQKLLSFRLDLSARETAKSIKDYLQNALVLVHLTRQEDLQLNAHGFQQRMPAAYFDPRSPLFQDLWARYKVAGIYPNILVSPAGHAIPEQR